jgi:seryl-tRNA synthetase
MDEDNLLGHYELTLKTQIANFDDATSVAGNRGYYLTGMGVKLNRALISYAIDFLEKENYMMHETPHMMLETALDGLTQLEDFQETLYKCVKKTDDKEPQYLIATSEQPLTAMFRNKILHYKEFPLKLGGLSYCYRKEAGKQGKDTLGLFRVHQFEKVEQFCVADPDNSWNVMQDMLQIAQQFYNSLGLSYQVINVHSQDLNNAASMKYDLEGYFPGAETKYRELVSCTNCTDYISKKIHTKDDKERFVHMLNATLCANTRTICCILETYQTPTGIKIPDVLLPYMGGVSEIPFVK